MSDIENAAILLGWVVLFNILGFALLKLEPVLQRLSEEYGQHVLKAYYGKDSNSTPRDT